MNCEKEKIEVPLPLNLLEKDRHLYEPYTSYHLSPVKVSALHDVFVAFTGFCLSDKGLVEECHHAYPSQLNDYINEAAQYYYSAEDDPSNLIVLDDDEVYLAIHHPWFNYYHWVCESVFRLWMVRDRLDEIILILPDHYRYADFIMGSLKPFNIKRIFFIPQEKSLLVKNLCLPQLKPVCDSYDRIKLKEVSSFYKDYIEKEKLFTSKTEKLYVSRELASRRKIVNESEVQEVLKAKGFHVFFPERHTFLEQVAVFSNVKFLVGAHGSGLTNMLFMNESTSVLELHQARTNELDHPSPLFWYMAEALRINYHQQLCTTHGKEDYFEGEYFVDTALLICYLSKMLNPETYAG